jgi:hypothetical protein
MISKIVVALTCLGIAACIFPTDSCSCVRAAPSGIVEGRVTHSSGAPAAGVLVKVSAATAPCPATSYTAHLLSPDTIRTSDAGEYELPVVVDFGSPTSACVRVTAQASTGTAVVSAPATLPLRGSVNDRVRVDIRLSD